MAHRGVLGHEFVGVVDECDDPAWLGRRVVADINAGCGACEECVLRNGHHCAKRTVLGIVGRPGALADEFLIPERCLVAVPDIVPDDAAVFAEPLAAALHVLDEFRPDDPRRAIVVGDGKLGLLIALALRSADIDVTLVGHHADKLRLASAHGITTLVESADDAAPAPVVVEATGSATGLRRALGWVAPRGTLILKTTVAGETSVDLSPVVVHEVRVVGSRCGSIAAAIDALTRGAVDPRPLISSRYALTDGERAFAHAAQRGTLKVLVDPTRDSAGTDPSR